MSPEKRNIPEWAARERKRDLEWVGENFHIFWPAATAAFAEQGRGALVVDTTTQPVKDAGHPFAYFPQAIVEEQYDEDVNRIVREYEPEKEFVVVMMKSEGRTSTYRVQPRPRQD